MGSSDSYGDDDIRREDDSGMNGSSGGSGTTDRNMGSRGGENGREGSSEEVLRAKETPLERIFELKLEQDEDGEDEIPPPDTHSDDNDDEEGDSPTPMPSNEKDDHHTSSGSSRRTSRKSSSKPSSRKTTPPLKKKKNIEVQLIGDLPRAEEDAFKTFVEIPQNHYQYGTLGRSREALESMTCDCQYDHGMDHPRDACGDGSDCINRLTQVECLPDDCRCRSYCQNQRFQRKEYAPIEIVQTEKKGFGLRAAQNLSKDTFIYEYVGDVVSQPSFLKRMRTYAEEGIRHFYFMMLQKDEYIDATKRGGIGRFANHSCNPNCYVAKWTVGDHVRMGIFANRRIQQNEELTFNYNVDRYGHDAQPCYCGEPNCVGFIGGKTQTDFAAMDDMYFEALGITDEEEKLGLKGSKKKKGKKIDDDDFVPDLRSLLVKEVPKFLGAMRQTTSRKMLHKLLTRLKMTDDQTALREFMRLRGFSAMTNLLEDNKENEDICSLVLECLLIMPLIHRNKVEDSKIESPVKDLLQSKDEKLAELAQKAIDQWAALEMRQKIKKRTKEDGGEEVSFMLYDDAVDESPPPKRARRSESPKRWMVKPLGYSRVPNPPARAPKPKPIVLREPVIVRRYSPPPPPRPRGPSKESIAAVIAAAAQAKIEADALAAAEAEAKAKAKAEEEEAAAAAAAAAEATIASSGRKHSKSKVSKEEKEAAKEKRLMKLIGAVVVKCMSKYRDKMDHDQFKTYAKELTTIIAEKEKKSHSYKDNKLDSLSDEKVVKIKKFSKEYVHKILRKLEKSKKQKSASSSSSSHRHRTSDLLPSASKSSLVENDNGSLRDDDGLPDISLEDTMDIDEMVEHGANGHGIEDDEDESGGHPSPDDDVALDAGEPDQTPASTSSSTAVSDPRMRHRHEDDGWESSRRISIPFKAKAKALRGC